MSKEKVVKDVMVDVFGYPHIPYWFTTKNAMDIIKKSFLETDSCARPMAVLVFDQQYNLMGLVTIKNILLALEPKTIKSMSIKDADIAMMDENGLLNFESKIFYEEMKDLAQKPVSEIMTPVKTFVSPQDSIVKAGFLMIRHNLTILPVLEEGKKLVGVVRLTDVFKEICNILSS